MATNELDDSQTEHAQADDDHERGASPGPHVGNGAAQHQPGRKLISSAPHVQRGPEPARPVKVWTLAVGPEDLRGVSVERRPGGKALCFDTRLRLRLSDPHVREMLEKASGAASSPAGLAADVWEGDVDGASGGVVPQPQAHQHVQHEALVLASSPAGLRADVREGNAHGETAGVAPEPQAHRDGQQKILVTASAPAGVAADVQGGDVHGGSGRVVPEPRDQRQTRFSRGRRSRGPEQSVPIEDTPAERDSLRSGSWPMDSVLRIENVETGLAPHEARIFLQSMFDKVGTVLLLPPVEDEEGASGFIVFRDSSSAAAACNLLTADTCLVASSMFRPWLVSRAEETDEVKKQIAHAARAQFDTKSSLSQERAATSPLRWFTAFKEREYKFVLSSLRRYKEYKEKCQTFSRRRVQEEEERKRTIEAEQQRLRERQQRDQSAGDSRVVP